MTLKRAISVEQMYSMKFPIMKFEGVFKASFGQPQLGSSWIIFGNSSNGKTSLAMQLAKYLTNFGKVIYNSYEEGASMSFQNTIMRNQMRDVSKKFTILDGEPLDHLTIRLKRKRSPNIIIIDSVQHSKITKDQYKLIKSTFPNKLFIYISHARGKSPKGEIADFIRYDSDLKIRVEGFRAFVDGRLNESEGKFFDIYPEKSTNYWNEL